jgi:DNA-binding NtrC family response regulator
MPVITKIIYFVSEVSALELSIQKALTGPGILVQCFSDPMTMIKTTIGSKPDAVISDFQFNALMGLEVIQQIKIKYPDMPSILLVNSESHPDVKKARELGTRILIKPVDITRLKELLRSVLRGGTGPVTTLKNIMIVEKNPNIRFMIKKQLPATGYEITELNNPFEMIEKYYLKKWSMIILDIDNDFMPQEEFLKIAAEKKFDPNRFILLANLWDNNRMNRFMSQQFPHFVTIPLETGELKKIIDIIISISG